MRASLSQDGVVLEERDFFQNSLTGAELRELIGDRPVADVFSWKSPSFKKLGLDRDSLGDEDLLRLMLDEPRLIRRPLIRVGEQLFIGAGLVEAVREALA